MRFLDRLTSVIKNPGKIVIYADFKGWLRRLPDKIYLKLMYRIRIGKSLNLENPKSFNEKLQWLKLHDHQSVYTDYVDKFEVRKYIAASIGQQYTIPLIGVYESFENIDFDQLPDAFVLKCTHDSGGVIVCKEKENFNIEAARNKIDKCLKTNFYYNGREWPYKNVKPRIICEKYMVDELNKELIDYKFMCFNGEVKCSFVCLNRDLPSGLNVDFYDMDWNPMPFERYYSNSGTEISKPKNFDKMVEFAERLSKGIPFLRVDFYEVNGQLYFGELTFFPGSGFERFMPSSYDDLLGSWIDLSLQNENMK
ncbi:glycosyl transferase [Paenibacillus sp. FSL H8-0548]|uniref:ATP-grasp fold amidoligase family protein n=1 Tax=Paenibacillus sp. FSL H8-0548 TaxID=1920422 RepID=UPI00096C2D09|nr:ATP-grasp fold amidoligase family protein [Paenibacillus sp. FSL H8-0548]OMF32605.1 glycosyl transferase [Paenibacillus sp. FSL H8-0548]